MAQYKFAPGDRVRIRESKASSIEAKKHAGEVVTIKARCGFMYAYELEELPSLWAQGCFELVERAA